MMHNAHFSPLFFIIAHCLCAKLQFIYMYTVSSIYGPITIYTELWGVLYICDLYTLGYSINKQCTLYWALCTLHQSAHHSLYISVQQKANNSSSSSTSNARWKCESCPQASPQMISVCATQSCGHFIIRLQITGLVHDTKVTTSATRKKTTVT